MHDDPTITDPQWPGWRARLVADEDAGQPWGDALAPALIISRYGDTYCAKEVFQPAHADRIVAAWHHLDDCDLFERYLRIVHATTTIASATDRDVTVLVFDTGKYRHRVGVIGRCDLTGGIVVEQHSIGTTRREDPTGQWREVDSLWGLYGYNYAADEAWDLLQTHAAGSNSDTYDGTVMPCTRT